MAKKFIMTRSACNFYYPEICKQLPDVDVKKGGWVSKDMLSKSLSILSPKLTILLLNLVKHPNQKHVVFTFFKQKSGVILISSILNMCGVKNVIFSGDLNDGERKKILKKFNNENNRYAQHIQVILVTEAGAEGITIREARHFHILESGPNVTRIQQAMGRVIRYKSHSNMPKEEQTVKVWRYWSILSFSNTIEIEIKSHDNDGNVIIKKRNFNGNTDLYQTSDVTLYEKGERKLRAITSFLEEIKRTSITPYTENKQNNIITLQGTKLINLNDTKNTQTELSIENFEETEQYFTALGLLVFSQNIIKPEDNKEITESDITISPQQDELLLKPSDQPSTTKYSKMTDITTSETEI